MPSAETAAYADKKVHHRKNVKGVENAIEVAGPVVEDQQLRNKLGEKLAYDRVGYDGNCGPPREDRSFFSIYAQGWAAICYGDL